MVSIEGLNSFLIAFSGACVFVLLLIPLAPRLSLMDMPRGHKQHDGETPVIGGLAVFMSIVLTSLALARFENTGLGLPPAALLCSAFLVLVGMTDDRWGLPITLRFGAQIVAALGMVFLGGVVIHDLGPLVSSSLIDITSIAVPFTVFATVGTINAMNFIDGVDGLAGALATTIFGLLAIAGALADRTGAALALIGLMGAVMGFLAFNLRCCRRDRAAVFLGDAGSTMLGFLITWFLVDLSQGSERAIAPVTALWLFAVPLFDATGAMLRRMLRGSSPFSSDRFHLHHLLMEAGFSVQAIVVILVALQVMMGSIGLIAWYFEVAQAAMFYSFIVLFGVYFCLIIEPSRCQRLIVMLRRGLWWKTTAPMEIFVGGFPESSADEVLQLCDKTITHQGISLWKTGNPSGQHQYHAVITATRKDAVSQLQGRVLYAIGRYRNLIIRPYVRRAADRRSRDRRVTPPPYRERRLNERRAQASQCVAQFCGVPISERDTLSTSLANRKNIASEPARESGTSRQ